MTSAGLIPYAQCVRDQGLELTALSAPFESVREASAADDFESGLRGLSREKPSTASKIGNFGRFRRGMSVALFHRQLEGQMLYVVIVLFAAAAFGYVKVRRQRKGAAGH
jgi:hypothetical protein